MKLSKLLEGVKIEEIINNRDIEVSNIEHDSRKVKEDTLFKASNSVNTRGNPAEQASSTTLTETASPITPKIANKKLFSLVNLRIFLNIDLRLLSSTTSQPLS